MVAVAESPELKRTDVTNRRLSGFIKHGETQPATTLITKAAEHLYSSSPLPTGPAAFMGDVVQFVERLAGHCAHLTNAGSSPAVALVKNQIRRRRINYQNLERSLYV